MLIPLAGGSDLVLLLILALVLDACVGDSPLLGRVLPGPGTLTARMVAWADKRLNRIDRSDAVRRARGSLLLLALAGGAILVGLALALVARGVPYGWALELLVVWRCLALHTPYTGARAVLDALAEGGLEAGRAAVAPLTDRQAWSLDLHGVVRAGVEGLATGFGRGVVAPALWYGLTGLPGLLLWTAVAATAGVIGHTTPRHVNFGAAARAAARWLGLLPSLLAALLLALAAPFVPKGRPAKALSALGQAGTHPMGDAAWPVAALAGALDLALAGPRRMGEAVAPEPWLGQGRARALSKDLRTALSLYAVAAILTAGLATAAALALTLR